MDMLATAFNSSSLRRLLTLEEMFESSSIELRRLSELALRGVVVVVFMLLDECLFFMIDRQPR